MALKDIVKISRKTFFNPSGWFGFDSVKATTITIWTIIRGLLTPPIADRTETFEQAAKRLNLSEADIQDTEQRYALYAYVFLLFGVTGFVSSFYFLFYHGTFAGFLLAIAAGALFLSQAFKYHFWFFQIKYRKLGCTFQEWRAGKPFDREDK